MSAIPFVAASKTTRYSNEVAYAQHICQSIAQDAGRLEPYMAAELSRFREGYLRTVDIDGEYYATEIAGTPLPEWIIVYGAQSQRGNSKIGYVQTNNLTCEASGTLD